MAKHVMKLRVKKGVDKKKKRSDKYCLYLLRGGPQGKSAYVGVTNKTPQLRLKQHNRELSGGAKATKKLKGTWRLHLVVSGLKSKKAALVFEHAVQQPTTPPGFLYRARLLKGLLPFSEQFTAVRARCKGIKKGDFASSVVYRERVIKELLQMELWRPLTAAFLAAPAPVQAEGEVIDLTGDDDDHFVDLSHLM